MIKKLVNPGLAFGSDISIGLNKLKTTNHFIKEFNSAYLTLRDIGDTTETSLILDTLDFWGLQSRVSGDKVMALNADNAHLDFHARDNGVGLIEVARMAGGADPYFAMGGSQQFKFYNSGVADVNTLYFKGPIYDISSLPSSNPNVAGQLYYISATGVVMRSAG
jgi:hypothetical protein